MYEVILVPTALQTQQRNKQTNHVRKFYSVRVAAMGNNNNLLDTRRVKLRHKAMPVAAANRFTKFVQPTES
jgi:hypothetical protein